MGVKCQDGDIRIHFPLGYHLGKCEKEIRRDILLLFAVLASFTKKRDSVLQGQAKNYEEVDFPMQSYLYLIRDFLTRGYYREREARYQVDGTGKIHWGRTIKTRKPYIQDLDVCYLDFVTRKSQDKEDELLTRIHEYCVYESFQKVGWLFTASMPAPPRIGKKDRVFKQVLRDKIAATYQDRNRQLFGHMLAIMEYKGDPSSGQNYRYGTYRFEYVWEKMIDRAFGIPDKAEYFPRTWWSLKDGIHPNACLEPDTIMILEEKVFVLDAKYYKYGITGDPRDLPESASINKQITYGEYVAMLSRQKDFPKKHGKDVEVYNAFLMPYDAVSEIWADRVEDIFPAAVHRILKEAGEEVQEDRYRCAGEERSLGMRCIGEAWSDWKDRTEAYMRIKGILIDMKALMCLAVRREKDGSRRLAELIAAGGEPGSCEADSLRTAMFTGKTEDGWGDIG